MGTSTAGATRYEFMRGQAAIVTEIYLPAKYVISPRVLQALDDALKPQSVLAHFDAVDPTEVKEFLPPTLEARYEELRASIGLSQRCFGGYSIYDLKGAWTTDSKDIERDANACIRLVDWPTAEALFHSDSPAFQRVIRTVFALRQHHEARPDILATDKTAKDTIDEVCIALDKWIDEGSFLLYGFVMYHLGKGTDYREKEILLTSHFAVVNRFPRAPRTGCTALATSS